MNPQSVARQPFTAGALVALLILLLLISMVSASASVRKKSLPADAAVRFDQARRTVTSIEAKNLLAALPTAKALARANPGAAAIAFVAAHRETFRLKEPAQELRVTAAKTDELGFRHVRVAQIFRAVPVVNAEMLFHFNREGALYLVTANYIATPALADLTPRLNRSAALRAAASAVGGNDSTAWPASLKIWPSPTGAGVLAYEVEATIASDKAWRVYVDGNSGEILARISTIYTASPHIRARPESTPPPP